VAQSHAGDYHDNMNSEIFIQWVKRKLVPTFNRRYPEKKMIFVADNAHITMLGKLALLQM